MAGSFTASIAKFKDDTAQRIDDQCIEICQELFTDVITKTPVGVAPEDSHPGLLVAGWYVGIGTTNTSKAVDTDESRTSTASRMRAEVVSGIFLNTDNKVTFTNSSDYAYRAEYLGWRESPWKGKRGADGSGAPYAMVRLALTNIVQKYGV